MLTMSIEDFAKTIIWEGGVEGALEYGLRFRDLGAEGQGSDFGRAWRHLEDFYQLPETRKAYATLEDVLEEYEN